MEGSGMIQAYNNLHGSFPVKRGVLYQTRNRGELKKVYDSIVSLSNRSPFYKIDISQENQEYAIGIKETALELKARLKRIQEPDNSCFQSKTVSVSDKNILSAVLLNENTEVLPDQIEITVNSLANVQINKGKELLNASFALPVGGHDFTATVSEETYPITYYHNNRMSNQDALKNMADLITQSVPGISATVEMGSTKDYSRLVIVSDMAGRFGEKEFSFEDDETFGEGIVDFFGMNRIDKASSSSDFVLNGMEKQTATNNFTLENTLHILLNNSGEKPVTLEITHDSDKILSAVELVISTYNDIIGLAKERIQDQGHYSASKLISEMKSLQSAYSEEILACGIIPQEDGTLKIDDSLAVTAAKDGGMESLFTRETGFMARLLDKSVAIAINPMDYLEKIIVLYPNSEKAFYSNPYVTSMYSGMLFNSYC